MKSLTFIFIALLSLTFLSGCEKIHKMGLGNRVRAMMGEDVQEMGEPEKPILKTNVHCCFCQELPEFSNVLLHAASNDDCSGKARLATYKNCKKVILIEGDCSLVNIAPSRDGYTCKGISRFYMEDGIKKEVTPPPVKVGACNPSTSSMTESFENIAEYSAENMEQTDQLRVRERRRNARKAKE